MPYFKYTEKGKQELQYPVSQAEIMTSIMVAIPVEDMRRICVGSGSRPLHPSLQPVIYHFSFVENHMVHVSLLLPALLWKVNLCLVPNPCYPFPHRSQMLMDGSGMGDV